ncbi:MAG: hypothetical protein GY928_39795 [Colwellia sp.]|nr:hypothetical protein [Colwellia sp.]
MPSASDMELHVVFMMAEQEWKNTSERWKAMHAAKKARGEKVGAAHPSYNRDKLTARNKRTNTVARTHAEKYRASVELMVDMKMSLRGIAGKLAEIGAKTQQGKLYTHNSVNNLCKLLDIDRKTFKLGGSVELVA